MATTVSPPSATAIRPGTRAKPPLQQAAQTGLVGGGFILLTALIGMLASFAQRDIINARLSSGQAILFILIWLTGYLATKQVARRGQAPVNALLAGGVAGGLAGGVLALFVLLGQAINLRAILVNASPQLYELLTFGQGAGVGAALLVVGGALLGALGALIWLMPDRLSRAVVWGLAVVVVMGLLQELMKLMVRESLSADAARWLYRGAGLTVPGALFLFVLPVLVSLGWSTYGGQAERRYQALPATSQRSLRWVGIGVALLFVLIFPQLFGSFPAEVMNNVALLGILMGLGLNIVVGFAGLLDLGYVGFFAIGAYTMALLTSPEIGSASFTFWTALPISVLVSIIAGVILGVPVLKMRGDYLAIVTLGFGEIIRILFLSDALRPYVGGARGITQVPNPSVIGVGPLNDPTELYYLLILAVGLTWFISTRLRDSRLGRAWMAIREDEDVAEAMGIDLVATKLLAFGTGAAMAGLGGAIFAAKLQSIVPQTFDLLISVNALSVIIIGGLGSIPGVIVGALLLIGLPEAFREFAEYRLWVYGALLVVMMLYRPEGFWPEITHKRELHSHDNPDLTDDATIASDLTHRSGPNPIPDVAPMSESDIDPQAD